MRPLILAVVASTAVLAGCQTSDRFGSNPFGGSERVSPPPPVRQAPPRIETAPTARIETAPLAPPPGVEAAPLDAPVSEAPVTDGGVTTPGTAQGGATPQQTARAEPRVAEPEPAAPTRTSVTGNWNVREAAGNCRITLSSSPKLDLYGATTAGCQSRELQRVTAWELRGEDVYLYEPGGTVSARLKARGRSMDGTLAKTGAPIALAK